MRPWVAVLWIAGCGDEPTECKDCTESGDADTDADADADSDADTDADTDADADTDTTPVDTVPADLGSCVAVVERDLEDDGSIDAVVTFTYDPAGLVVLTETADADAATPAVVELVRDGAGDEVERRVDQDGDGVVDDVFLSTRDAGGNLLTYCQDRGNDGDCDVLETIGYDANGWRVTYDQDSNGDGVDDFHCDYTNDAQGRRLGYTCAGSLAQSAAYTYSELTFWDVIEALDLGDDGSVDVRTEDRFDAEGRPIYGAEDEDGDGDWDVETTTSYNPDGTLSLIEGEVVAPPATFRFEYVYDADGYLIQTRFGVDVTGEGAPDVVDVESWSWTCG